MGHGRWASDIVIEHPGRARPWVVSVVRRVLVPLCALLHRATLEGTEHLPERGPYLLVANHSAGMGIAEILCFIARWTEDVGPARPIAGFALPIGFRVFPLSRLLRSVGAVPSTYADAARTLAMGVPLLVFPGGDHEALRPVWQANRIDLGGRVGFLRIARDARVPIVPLAIRGAHFTAPILLRSRALATLLVVPRLIGTKRWGLSVLGLIGAALLARYVPASWPVRAALVWLWLGSPLTLLPWVPWKIRMRIGPALSCEELFEEKVEAGSDDAILRRALARAEAALRAKL